MNRHATSPVPAAEPSERELDAQHSRLGVAPPAPPTAPDAASQAGDGRAVEAFAGEAEARFVGPYRLLERIGEGAMGEVYRAEHQPLGRKVAIKLVRPEIAARRECMQRLFAEARAANRVRSEHVVEVTDFCFDPEGETYLVMELLDGCDLATACERGDIDLHKGLLVIRQVCETMALLHGAGIVHRDLKPENVFLIEREGQTFVKLIDFGIAKLDDTDGKSLTSTLPGTVVGTPHYMAPEQASADPVNDRCDVYAVGVMLFEVLSGRCPFDSSSLRELLMDIAVTVPPPLSEVARLPDSVREPLDALLAACLQKEPRLRPDAETLRVHLDVILARLDGAEASDSPLVHSGTRPTQGAARPSLAQTIRFERRREAAGTSTAPRRLWLWACAGAGSVAAMLAAGVLALGPAPSAAEGRVEASGEAPLPARAGAADADVRPGRGQPPHEPAQRERKRGGNARGRQAPGPELAVVARPVATEAEPGADPSPGAGAAKAPPGSQDERERRRDEVEEGRERGRHRARSREQSRIERRRDGRRSQDSPRQPAAGTSPDLGSEVVTHPRDVVLNPFDREDS